MKKILIVDDSDFMRKMLRNTLNEIGKFEIIEANDYQTGLDKFNNNNPEICFCDIVLGEKTGLDLLKIIKKEENDTKVIMLSSAGQKIIVTKALENGATAFLDKPFIKKDIKKYVT